MEPDSRLEVAQALTPSIFFSSLKVGAGTAIAGGALGAVVGTLRTTTPVLYAAQSGIQCFGIGASYWAIRQSALIECARQNRTSIHGVSPGQKLICSAAAGGLSGAIVAMIFRGRANVIPGVIVFSIVTGGGQLLVNLTASNRTDEDAGSRKESRTLTERFLKSRLNPMKELPDQDYEKMLQEKLIRVEAEIAFIDEAIEKTKQEGKE